MDSIIQLIDGQLRLSASAQTVAIAMMASAIFTVCLALLFIVARFSDPMRKRLEAIEANKPLTPSRTERIAESLDQYSRFILPSGEKERKTSHDRLAQAGYRSANRLIIYYFIRLAAMILLPVSVFLIYPILASNFSVRHLLWFSMIAGLVGLLLPSYILDKIIARRQRHLRNALPDALDLLVACTEAGLGLNAAIIRVAQELNAIHPSFAEELSMVNAEIRAGIDRDAALKNLAQRTGLEDIKGLVTLLAQSMRFGTSIAQTLRVYSDEFRDKRMQKAEEEAAKLATKMIFPLILCMLPAFFIVAVGPAIIKIAEAFAQIPH